MNPTFRKSLLACALSAGISAGHAMQTQWMHDQDANKIDDRIERVNAEGFAAAFENNDTVNGRLEIAAFDGAVMQYGVYVGYDRKPTDADLAAIQALGVAATYKFDYIHYIEALVTFDQILTLATNPDVSRIEAVPVMYANNDVATASSGASGESNQFNVHDTLGITGAGVIVAILDTGVNDNADHITPYPGHESFEGKFIAGATMDLGIYGELSGLNDTEIEADQNPLDRGEEGSSNHGTHVAGTTLGTGGFVGTYEGVAPGADLVDVKVLSDGGAGFGSGAGAEAAIRYNERVAAAGGDQSDMIRIMNLSLGGTSNSDGTDANSRLMDAAFDNGIIAVIATGNDGNTSYMSSPAASSKSISVGSIDDINTVDQADDVISGFSNEGPRSGGNAIDDLKPEVSAGGSSIISAGGSLASDGRQYKSLSGTSMATPHVAGVLALMLEANPDLNPTDMDHIIRHTANHRSGWGKSNDQAFQNANPHVDPNYAPSGGWGQVHAFAAVKEALRLAGDISSQTQVIEFEIDIVDGVVSGRWITQREDGPTTFRVLRTEVADGTEGPAMVVHTQQGAGQFTIEGTSNRNLYTFTDGGLDSTKTYRYAVEHSSNPGTFVEPALEIVGEGVPVNSIGKVNMSFTHDDPANDLNVLFGTGASPATPNFAESVSVTEIGSSDLILSNVGIDRYDISVDLTDEDGVEQYLPPSRENPWWFSVSEAGYINRHGQVNSFSIEYAGQTYTSTASNVQTVHGQTVVFWIPNDATQYELGEGPVVVDVLPETGRIGETVDIKVLAGDVLPTATLEIAGEGVTVSNVTVDNATQMRATVAVDAGQPTSRRDITITNPDGTSYTAAGAFIVVGDGGGCGIPLAGEFGANDDAALAPADVSGVTIALTHNDNYDPCEDEIAITSVTNGQFGSVTIESADEVRYQPFQPYCSDTFSYTMQSVRGETGTASVTVTRDHPYCQ